jgi:uncharacterized membrane protein
MTEQQIDPTLTSDDKLWAMLAYMPLFGWIVAILALLMEDKRSRPFVKFHSVQALTLAIINGVVSSVLSFVLIGICTAIGVTIYMIYLGVKAYAGETIPVPFLTNFIKQQGWG